MKKIILVLIMLSFTFSLSSCFGEDNQIPESDNIKIMEQAIESITNSIPSEANTRFRLTRILPGQVTVNWTSSDLSIIDTSELYAIVNRSVDDVDQQIILTATFTLEQYKEIRDFKINVPTISLTPIEELSTIPVGNVVSVKGTVQSIPLEINSNIDRYFVVTDGTDNFRIRTRNMFQGICVERQWVLNNINIGDNVVIIGTREDFNGNKYLGVARFLDFTSQHQIFIL